MGTPSGQTQWGRQPLRNAGQGSPPTGASPSGFAGRLRAWTSATSVSALVGSLALVAAASLVAPPPADAFATCTPDSGYTDCAVFTYSGADEVVTVADGVTALFVKSWGAGGGGADTNYYSGESGGGAGGFASGTAMVTEGTTLTVKVGGGGRAGTNLGSSISPYGGGGRGGTVGTANIRSAGGSGGGLSGVFAGTTPVIVSGAGGGASPGADNGNPFAGGGGGDDGGEDGVPSQSGRGGSQTAGGAGATANITCSTPATDGAQFAGGNSATITAAPAGPSEGGGGGGSGYFGGGGGKCQNGDSGGGSQNGAGGGGSSYIGGVNGGSTTAGGDATMGFPGTGGAAPLTTDPKYRSGVAVGGAVVAGGGNGGNGLVVIQWARLSLTKINPATLTVGILASYTFEVFNGGTGTARNATVSDQLPANVAFTSSAGSNWSCKLSGTVAAGQVVKCTFNGSISRGSSNTALVIRVTPAPAAGGTTVQNKAAVDGDGGVTPVAPSLCTSTATPVGCAVAPAQTIDSGIILGLTKSSPSPALAVGYPSTYTLTVGNTGVNPAAGASIREVLPPNTAYVSAGGATCTVTGGSTGAGQTLLCTIPTSTVIAKTSGTATVTVVLRPLAAGASLVNKASVDPDGGTGPVDPATCTATSTPAGCALSPTAAAVADIVSGPSPSVTTPVGSPVTSINVKSTTTSAQGRAIVNPTIASSPANGTSTVNADGTLKYTPNAGFSGQDVFGYTICNNGVPATCDTENVTVTVTNVVTPGASVTTPQFTAVTTPLVGIATTTGKPLDPTRVTQVTAPAHGSLSISAATGAVTYTPAGSYTGVDTYQVQVCDTSMPAQCTAITPSVTVTPYVLPSAPTITAATAGSLSASLSWTTPAAGDSAITGYVVTPYIGGVAQTPQTFTGTATTRVVTGLTGGTAYTFRVAAQNLGGTGVQSAPSAAVTPNAAPSLVFANPPSGEVGVAYSQLLTVTGGTAPFVWSVSSGTLPAGLTLNPSSGLLSGTPTAAITSAVTIRVTDASSLTASKAITLVIAAVPTLAFSPAAGEVGVAYSQQPTLTGGTGPFAWTVSVGSLPAGLTLNSASGLVSGTPTASGSFPVTIKVTDSFSQVATRTATIVIVALPAFTAFVPPAGQVGVSYAAPFDVTGGTLPLTWSVSTGALPPGLALNPATGAVTGTPTTVGTTSFTVTVTDAKGQSAAKAVSVVVTPGPLVIIKTANVSSAPAGSVVAYTITVTNTGTAAFPGVALSDPLTGVLDDATYNANATATSGTLSYVASTLGWTGTLAASATVTITYSVTVNTPDVGSKVLGNTVSSSTLGTNCAGGSVDARCTATVTVPGLTIVKTADVATTLPGNTVEVTIVVTNTGQTAYPAATLTDSLAGMLDDATYNADAGATSGTIGYTSSILTWTGALAVGGSATITYSVRVRDPDPGNRTLTGTVVSPSVGSPCPSGDPAPSCSVSVTVLVPALVITTTATPATATPGATVSHHTTISNTGQTAYTGATVTMALADAVDDAIYGGNAAASGGSAGGVAYDPGTSILTWSGDLALGAAVTVTWTTTVLSPDPGDKLLTTVAASSVAGSTCPTGSPNPVCQSVVQILVPELTIATSADVSTTTPGSVVAFTVLVTNTGQTAYSSAVVSQALAGVLDDATYNGNVSATSGIASVTGSTLSWAGDLAVGATATITYSVTVRLSDTGDKSLTATATSATVGSTCPVGGSDLRCVTTVPVLVPAVAISVVADTGSTIPGSVVRYTVTVHNTGQTSYAGVPIIIDVNGVFDDADYNNDAHVSAGSLNFATATWVVPLAVGVTETGTLSVTVKTPPTGNRSMVLAVLSNDAGSSCPTGNTAPACRSVVPVLIPGLTITKTADVATTTPGDTVGYTITVVNSGETAASAATFTDDLSAVLDDATYGGGATASSGAVSVAGSVLSWSGALAVGVTATITYSVTVSDPGPGDKLMVNTVVSSTAGSNCAAGSADSRCRAAVFILVPGLTIVTSATVATTAPGGTVGYTIVVTNSGATPFTGAKVTDTLAGVLDDAAYNANAAATSGSVSITGGVLTWTGDLAVGATATITYSVTVNAADTGNDLLTDAVTSTARGSNCAVGSPDTRCATTVPVARLVITQSYAESTTTPGSVLHLTGTFTNTGQVPYTGITISSPSADTVDDAIPTGDQVATSGTLILSTTDISWTGNIPVGVVVTITGTLTVKDPDPGNKVITGTLVSSAPGNTCPSVGAAQACTALVTVLIPQLTITKVADTTAVLPGGTVVYTVTVKNTGLAPYTAASVTDSLAGILDKATYNNDATTTSGTVAFTSPTLTWAGDLPASASAVITYSITVPTAPVGDKTLVNTVSSTTVGSTCLPASSNAACHSTVVILTPALTLVKTASNANPTLGSTVTYTITATNTGQTPYPTAEFSDSLADVLDDATFVAGSATRTSGEVTTGASVLSWSGALLAANDSVTVTYKVKVNNSATGNGTLLNTVVSTNVGNNCPTGGVDTRCMASATIVNSVELTFAKTSDVAFTVASGVVHYTITITNASAQPVLGAQFTDPLANIVDDATYRNDAAAAVGTVGYTATNLNWTGDVAGLSTVTVTYSVTVHLTETGDLRLMGTVSSTSLDSDNNNCFTSSTDPRCTSRVNVAALHIEQHYTVSSTTPGSIVHLTGTFTNTGQEPYVGITIASPVADTVDDAIPSGDQVATSGSLVLNATTVTWMGSIPVGGTVTFTGSLTVENPDPGNRVLKGTLASAAPGSNCPALGADPACTATLPVLLPGLTISKSASATFVVPGGELGYTITVVNSGETAYAAASVTDTLVGIIDDATYDANASATSGTVTFTSPTLTWTGALALGAAVTITYSVTAHNPATGDKTMVNTVSSTAVGSTCLPASGNAACRSTVPVLTPMLTLTAAVSATSAVPGQSVTYTLTATNTGQVPYDAAAFTVPLAGVLDDAALSDGVTANIGTVDVADQDLSWTGALATGATATITYTVTVDDPVTGDFRLGQTIVSTASGSTCPDAGTDPRCATSVPIASLDMLNATDVATTKPGGIVRVTVTVTNVGQVPYVGTVINDNLVASIDDADYNGDATATSGSLIINPGTGYVVWTGDIPVGITVTVTATLTVRNPDPSDRLMTTQISTDAPATNCATADPTPAAACLTSVTVLIPKLTVSKTVSTGNAAPGATVGYTITVTNTGHTPYTGATLRDSLAGMLADATYNNDAAAVTSAPGAGGTVTYAAPTLTWVGDLALAQSVTITYSMTVNDPDLGGRTMVNAVTSDEIGSTCPTGGSSPACTTLVTVLVPALDVSVSADRTSTVPGGTVAYTVSIHNTGQTDYAAGTTVTTGLVGALDDATYAGGGTATAGTLTYASSTLTWTGGLALGATVTVSYLVAVKDPPVGNHQITTTMSSPATGSTCGSAAQCTNTVEVLIPGLAVTTTAGVMTTTPGQAVVFTTTLTNTGQTTYQAIAFTSSLTDVLDDATFDGIVSATIGEVTWASPVVTWTGILHVGDVATITYNVVVKDPDTGDRTLRAAVAAPAWGSTCPTGAEAGCIASVTVLIPALTISKTSSAPTTTPGGMVTYTVVIHNTGQTPYTGAVMSDSLSGVLPDATYNGNAVVAGGGVVAYTAPVLTWTGDLLVGASAILSYSIAISDPDPGDKLLVNTATSTAPGSTCPPAAPRPACTVEVRVLVPALVVTKTADATVVTAGSIVRYTITVDNTGETAYGQAGHESAVVTDSLTGVLDDAVYAGDADSTVGDVVLSGDALSWTGALPVGESATITYTVMTTFPALGDQTMSNTALSTSPGSTCATASDPGCTSVVAVLVPALTVMKTASDTEVVAGGSLTYTIIATNEGQSDYPAATLSDAMTGVIDDAIYNDDATATTGTISYPAGILTWSGALVRGASVVVTYSIDVPVSTTGDGVLKNRVVSASVGSNCVSASADPRCVTSTPIAARTLTLSGLPSSFTLTGLPNSTVTSDGGVTMTVTTNSTTGYSVSVKASSALLVGTTTNLETILIGRLTVRESGIAAFQPLSMVAQIIHSQAGPSAPGGDAISNDYRIDIPFVSSDTYSATLDYIASTQ